MEDDKILNLYNIKVTKSVKLVEITVIEYLVFHDKRIA